MATETTIGDWVLQFIADTARESAGGSDVDISSLVEAIAVGDQRTSAARQPSRVLVSGWPDASGVMILRAGAAGRASWRALVAALDERALRDLLLHLPFGGGGTLFLCGRWMLAAVRDLLAGDEQDSQVPAGVTIFAGIRRGGHAGNGRGGAAAHDPDARIPVPPLVAKDAQPVQRIRALREPAGRRAESGYVAEGTTVVRRAVDDGLPVESVLCRGELAASADGAELLRACARAGIPCYRCSDGLLGTITTTRPLPTALAAVHFALREVADLRTTPSSVLVVAEDLQNPDNLGMVVRTVDAGGAHALIVTSSGVDPLHKNCVRAARGAVGRLPLFECRDLPGWLASLAQAGFTIIGATAHGDAGLYEQVMRPPLVIAVGNEETGLHPATLAACTSRVRIPMAPGQSSMNVGVAAGVLLFEFVRQRARW
jgi:RNA methyltransferase, TrmH family